MTETESKTPDSRSDTKFIDSLATTVAGGAILGMGAAIVSATAPVVVPATLLGLIGGFFLKKRDVSKKPKESQDRPAA
jgi:hypothetical protein